MKGNIVKALGMPFMASVWYTGDSPEVPDEENDHTLVKIYGIDEIYDGELVDKYAVQQASFASRRGRFDPFAYDKLRESFESHGYSTFLKRNMMTLEDVLEHALELTRYWAGEDEELRYLNSDEGPAARATIKRQGYEENVEELRVHWRQLINERDRKIKEMNLEIRIARDKYQEAKNKRQR